MILLDADGNPVDMSFPRACGDDPTKDTGDLTEIPLFPAHAGMILLLAIGIASMISFPRACGDDPLANSVTTFVDIFSPRMRG